MQLRQVIGSSNDVFTVTLTPASPNPVTVNYSNFDGSAVNGIDYTAQSGSLTFPAGVTTQTVSVPMFPKAARGNDLYFHLSSSSAVNVSIQRSSAYAELINNVAPFTSPSYLRIADTSVNRPAASAAKVTFTMTLKPAPITTVTAFFYTADGSEIPGIDYTPVIGMVTLAPGQTSKTVTVPVPPSTAYQAQKVFSLSAINFTGLGVAMRNPAYATIMNQTALPRLNLGGDV